MAWLKDLMGIFEIKNSVNLKLKILKIEITN